MSFRLNERPLIQRVYENVPYEEVELIANDFPKVYLQRFFKFLTSTIEDSPHLEFNLRWIKALISSHGPYMMSRKHEFAAVVRATGKYIKRVNKDINKLSTNNIYSVQFLLGQNRKDAIVPAAVEQPEAHKKEKEKESDVDMKDKSEDESSDNNGDDDDDNNDDDDEGWFGPESKNGMDFSKFPSDDSEQDSDDE